MDFIFSFLSYSALYYGVKQIYTGIIFLVIILKKRLG